MGNFGLKKLEKSIGCWETFDRDSSARFIVIYDDAEGLKVSGIDTLDGEEFIISDVIFEDGCLTFTSEMESTGHRVDHLFRESNGESLLHSYTVTEKWVKVESDS